MILAKAPLSPHILHLACEGKGYRQEYWWSFWAHILHVDLCPPVHGASYSVYLLRQYTLYCAVFDYLFILLHEILSILRAAVELKFGSLGLCRGWHGPCSANICYMNLRVFV